MDFGMDGHYIHPIIHGQVFVCMGRFIFLYEDSFFLENRKVKLSMTVHRQVHHTNFQLNGSSQKGNEKRTQTRGNI